MRRFEQHIINYIFDDDPHDKYPMLLPRDPVVRIIKLYVDHNKCIFCNREFLNKSALKTHLTRHNKCSYKFFKIIRSTADRLKMLYDYIDDKKLRRSLRILDPIFTKPFTYDIIEYEVEQYE